MAQLTGFPLCCGADVLNGFDTAGGTQNPAAIHSYKTDGITYALDRNGKRIDITFAERFKADLESRRKMYPNRMYSCVLNERQYRDHNYGWPKLLKECGFEFVRRWSNSNHDGSLYGKKALKEHPCYLFVLCTDQKGKCEDNLRPPQGWEDLPNGPHAVEVAKAA